MKLIQASARKHKITIALGFSENDHDSLYISQCTINDSGELAMRRRKLMPTHMERTIFGNSSGNSLDNVVSTPVGNVGQLACWEHVQPLLKYHTITQREEFHVAAWPPVYEMAHEAELWSMTRDGKYTKRGVLPDRASWSLTAVCAGCRNLSRTYAIESQSFVLHTTSVLSQKGIHLMDTSKGPLMNRPGGGSSAVFGPDGRQLSEDIPETEEGIIYANVNLDDILGAKAFLDVVGHYSRPDLLWLGVDKKEKLHCRHDESKADS